MDTTFFDLVNASETWFMDSLCDDCPIQKICEATNLVGACDTVFVAAIAAGLIDINRKLLVDKSEIERLADYYKATKNQGK